MSHWHSELIMTTDGRPLYEWVNQAWKELSYIKSSYEVHLEGGHVIRFSLSPRKKWWQLWKRP